jgi:hypothetical protein
VVKSAVAGNYGGFWPRKPTAASQAARRRIGAVNRAIDGKGGLPVITNQLVGQVDNPSYPYRTYITCH